MVFHVKENPLEKSKRRSPTRNAAKNPTRLRLLRLAAGLTQAELEEKAGVNRVLISRVEQGAGGYPKMLKKLADVLGEADPERLLERGEAVLQVVPSGKALLYGRAK